MTVIFLIALVTLVIVLYLQARTDARRIRRQRDQCGDAHLRRLVLTPHRLPGNRQGLDRSGFPDL